jgi:hypothetical protein
MRNAMLLLCAPTRSGLQRSKPGQSRWVAEATEEMARGGTRLKMGDVEGPAPDTYIGVLSR